MRSLAKKIMMGDPKA